MTNYLRITNQTNSILWEKQLTNEEYEEVLGLCAKSRNAVSITQGVLVPIRTNNLGNFSRDFFLPTVQQAIKVQNVADKVIAIIAAFIVDVITLPIRLVTCIPRGIYNSLRGEIQLKKYLMDKGADKKVFESDQITIKLRKGPAEPPIIEFPHEIAHRTIGNFNDLEKPWTVVGVNLIDVPQ